MILKQLKCKIRNKRYKKDEKNKERIEKKNKKLNEILQKK